MRTNHSRHKRIFAACQWPSFGYNKLFQVSDPRQFRQPAVYGSGSWLTVGTWEKTAANRGTLFTCQFPRWIPEIPRALNARRSSVPIYPLGALFLCFPLCFSRCLSYLGFLFFSRTCTYISFFFFTTHTHTRWTSPIASNACISQKRRGVRLVASYNRLSMHPKL